MASFTYDSSGTPTSVTMGNNPQTAPRYYYVYNGHGDVVTVADANGNVMASYTYDEYGIPLSSSESFPGGWTNSYRYDGRDRVRYYGEPGLYWMSMRAYDPTLGRFISRDPLGRVPLMGWTSQPYAYAGNNPLVNMDPSGQRLVGANGAVTESAGHHQAAAHQYYRVQPIKPRHPPAAHPTTNKASQCTASSTSTPCWRARQIQENASTEANSFAADVAWITGGAAIAGAIRATFVRINSQDEFMTALRGLFTDTMVKTLLAGVGAVVAWQLVAFAMFYDESTNPLDWYTDAHNVSTFFSHMNGIVTSIGLMFLGVGLVGGGLTAGAAFLDPFFDVGLVAGLGGAGWMYHVLHDEQHAQIAFYSETPPMDMVSCQGDPGAYPCNVV